jgi:hypothetical protein
MLKITGWIIGTVIFAALNINKYDIIKILGEEIIKIRGLLL